MEVPETVTYKPHNSSFYLTKSLKCQGFSNFVIYLKSEDVMESRQYLGLVTILDISVVMQHSSLL